MNSSHQVLSAPDLPELADLPASGSRFEDECIGLLCKQEHTLTALGEASSRGRTLDVLELARKMLLQFLDFAEQHFSEKQLQRVGERLYDVNSRTREYENMVDASSFRAVKKLFGVAVPDNETTLAAHNKLREDYVTLYREFFDDCATSFAPQGPVREQFLESVATFLSELERRWQ